MLSPAMAPESAIHVVSTLDQLNAFGDEPIRIRLTPQIYDKSAGPRGAYVGWTGVSWIAVVQGKSGAKVWLDTVRLFFEVLSAIGPSKLQRALRQLLVEQQQ
jgi:hypothetical protein